MVLAELLAERYGGPARLRPPAAPSRTGVAQRPVTPPDVAAIAERQRMLCEALDGAHLIAVTARERAA